MSARMQYPLSQRRHTNVAVVRYTRNGVRLEIACYKNKVMSYRAGTERRLDEVLQVERVFSNVARGHVASEKELIAVFGPGISEHAALQHILVHGEVQVAQHERSVELEDVFKDVAMIIAQKCVHAQTQRPLPLPVIAQALRSMGAAVKMDQPAKKQALALMHQLMASQVLPLRRANMRLRCNTTTAAARALVEAWCVERGVEVLQRCGADDGTPSPQQQQQQQEQQEQHVDDVDDDSNARNHAADADDDDDVHKDVAAPAPPLRHRVDATWSLLITAQPHLYRELDEFVKQHLPPGSTVHTVDAAVMELHNHSSGSSSSGTNTAAVTAASLPSTSSEVDRDDVVGGSRHARTRSATAATTSTSSLSRTDGTRAQDAQSGRGKTRKQQQQQKQRQRRHGRKGNDSDSDDDDSGSDDDEKHRANTTRATSSAAQLSAELRALSVASDDVDAEATAVTRHVAQRQHSADAKKNSKHNNNNNGDDDDSDDDDAHRRRRQKKGGGGRKKTTKPSAQQQQQQQQQQPPNSDDEIEGNRRQRKQAKKKEEDAQHHTDNVYNEDDEYACMYDDDDGSEVDGGDGDKNDAAREGDAADVVVATTTTTAATDGTA